MRAHGLRLAIVLMIAGLSACAPKQRIPLEVTPPLSTLYLDGEALETIPPELELRSDRAHVLFFKSEGFRPERVVLESSEVEGKSRLQPATVQVRLRPAGPGHSDFTIELNDPPQKER